MGFKLKINYSGLCMFVPRAAAGGNPARMHVLMPKTRGHEHGSDRHVPVLWFDAAHLRQGSTVGDDVFVLRSLLQRTILFPGSGADTEVPYDIVNLRSVTNRPVDNDHLGRDSRGQLVSRVTMEAGEFSAIAPGAVWEWAPNEFRHLAFQAAWTITNTVDTSLTLELRDFAGNVIETLQPLYPLDPTGVNEINLFIHHVTTGDLPPEPEENEHEPDFGFVPLHFLSFYAVFGGAVTVRLPQFWGTDPQGRSFSALTDRGGSPFNCILASDY